VTPTWSVDAFHDNDTSVSVEAVLVSEDGAEGTVVSAAGGGELVDSLGSTTSCGASVAPDSFSANGRFVTLVVVNAKATAPFPRAGGDRT
jgi:hypothetical protein